MQQPIPQRLVSDQALVIVGPQGSGKKLLAQQLAKKHAPYEEVDIERVLDEYLFHGVLKSTPRTLIIDGFAQSPTEDSPYLPTSQDRRFNVFTMPPGWMPQREPHIVYSSGHADALGPKNNDRRFWPVTA